MVSGSLHIFELNHRLHSSYEKSVVEGTIEYLKDGMGLGDSMTITLAGDKD